MEDEESPDDLPRGLALEGRLMVKEGQVQFVDLLLVAVRSDDEAIATHCT